MFFELEKSSHLKRYLAGLAVVALSTACSSPSYEDNIKANCNDLGKNEKGFAASIDFVKDTPSFNVDKSQKMSGNTISQRIYLDGKDYYVGVAGREIIIYHDKDKVDVIDPQTHEQKSVDNTVLFRGRERYTISSDATKVNIVADCVVGLS